MKFSSRKDEILYGIALQGANAFRAYDDGSSIALVRGPIRVDPPFADVGIEDARYVKEYDVQLPTSSSSVPTALSRSRR